MIEKLRKYLTPRSHQNLEVDATKEAEFKLILEDLEIGRLYFKDNLWMFKYSEEFKETSGIDKLSGFPDVTKTYKSNELWPFFSSRIPSLSRLKVKDTISKERIKENDLIALLNRFGRHTITNPFELLSVK